MRRRTFLKTSGAGALSLLAGSRSNAVDSPSRPNIVWIIAEDMSCHFGYQGEPLVKTPHVDRIAREGAIFESAYASCPVCSPSRSALITGMYQTTIGAHNHRSFRGAIKHELPAPVRPIPEYFKAAGYYVCNGSRSEAKEAGKTDYNFECPSNLYDGADYSGAAPDQPIFMQFQLQGGKFRRAKVEHEASPDAVVLPPYYPNDPVLREDWARYLNSVMYVDREVGNIMARLEADGRAKNAVIFFTTDHGISHARGKQFLYEEGTHVPLIVWSPDRIPAGTKRGELVSQMDIAATSLYFADIPVPRYMESRSLFGPDSQPREYVISARDRCDETVDRIRSVRKGTFTYVRNFYPERPHLQPNAYKDAKEILIRLRGLYAEGKLAGHPAERLLATPRPKEELYNRETDPWELNNLADDATYAQTLAQMRGILDGWVRATNDKGQFPESEEAYDADMALYFESRKNEPESTRVFERNVAQMKAWAAEGK